MVHAPCQEGVRLALSFLTMKWRCRVRAVSRALLYTMGDVSIEELLIFATTQQYLPEMRLSVVRGVSGGL